MSFSKMEKCYNQEIENLKHQVNVQTKRLDIREKQVQVLDEEKHYLKQVNSSLREEVTNLQEHLEQVSSYNHERLQQKNKEIESLMNSKKKWPSNKTNKYGRIKNKGLHRENKNRYTGKPDVNICKSEKDYQRNTLQEVNNIQQPILMDKSYLSVFAGRGEKIYEKIWKEKDSIEEKKNEFLLKGLIIKAKYLHRARLDMQKIDEKTKENLLLKQKLEAYQDINQKLENELAKQIQNVTIRKLNVCRRFREETNVYFLPDQQHTVNSCLPVAQTLNGIHSDCDLEFDENRHDALANPIVNSTEQSDQLCPQCGYQFNVNVLGFYQVFKPILPMKTHSGANSEKLAKYVSMAVSLKLRNFNKAKQAKEIIIKLRRKLGVLQEKLQQYRTSISKIERERDLYIQFTAEICKQAYHLFENLKLD